MDLNDLFAVVYSAGFTGMSYGTENEAVPRFERGKPMMVSSYPLDFAVVEESGFLKGDELAAMTKMLQSLAEGECSKRDHSPARQDHGTLPFVLFLDEAEGAWAVIRYRVPGPLRVAVTAASVF